MKLIEQLKVLTENNTKQYDVRKDMSRKYGFIAMYKEKKIEIYADSQYQAQVEAAKILGAKKSYNVIVVLAEKDGEDVIYKAVD
jgi:hypothetical protein